MIKNFLYGIIAIIIIAFSFTSCEDANGDNFRVDTDSGYVQFPDNDEISFVGGFHTLLEIPVDLHTNTNITGLNLYYKIEKISESDIGTVIVNDPGFVRFDPGQITSTTKIEVKSDIPAAGFAFKITLSSANRDNISFLKDVENVYLTKKVYIRPIILATNYVGEVYRVDLNSDGSQKAPTYVSDVSTSLTPTTESDVYAFGNGAWGSVFVPTLTGNPVHAALNYPGNITISPDGNVVVDGDESENYTSVDNKGSLNSFTREITYTLKQELFNQDFLVKVVIRPDE